MPLAPRAHRPSGSKPPRSAQRAEGLNPVHERPRSFLLPAEIPPSAAASPARDAGRLTKKEERERRCKLSVSGNRFDVARVLARRPVARFAPPFDSLHTFAANNPCISGGYRTTQCAARRKKETETPELAARGDFTDLPILLCFGGKARRESLRNIKGLRD